MFSSPRRRAHGWLMKRATFYIIGAFFFLLLVVSCASIGNPSGGPRDEDPPRFVSSNPIQGAVEVSPKRVVLTFDELVNLKDAFSKVVVSPPGAQVPRVSSLGRRVTVEFRDTLLPNTTYTIDFGDAIVDNNEGNKLENFIYTFSTGPVLDSLMISGMVLGAEDLDAPQGMYVGLHSNLADSAFTKTRFDRIAKTDENGKFVIGGLAPGQYRIYALDDRDGDLAWSSPEETLAFYDLLIEPTTESAMASDTIFNLKTGEVDSIVKRGRTRFLPNNILLRPFNTGFRQQYITKYERADSARINFIFNAPADSMPVVDVILPSGRVAAVNDIAAFERSATNDTLSFWLHEPEFIRSDTLRVALQYFRADSAYNMVPVNDTLRLLKPKDQPKKDPKALLKKNRNEQVDSLAPVIPTIQIKSLVGKPEVNQPVTLEFPTPPAEFNVGAVHLQVKVDSLWNPVSDFDVGLVSQDTLNPRRFRINYPWNYETAYKITVDSVAGRDIYGLYTDPFSLEFTTRPENEYSSLQFNVSNVGPDSIPLFVELLDSQGKPIRRQEISGGRVLFEFLLSGTYGARVVQDFNGNGKWDPGNFYKGQQPDLSYYYPEMVDIKQNWSQELDWNVFSTPVDKMKPEKLRTKKKNTTR